MARQSGNYYEGDDANNSFFVIGRINSRAQTCGPKKEMKRVSTITNPHEFLSVPRCAVCDGLGTASLMEQPGLGRETDTRARARSGD